MYSENGKLGYRIVFCSEKIYLIAFEVTTACMEKNEKIVLNTFSIL